MPAIQEEIPASELEGSLGGGDELSSSRELVDYSSHDREEMAIASQNRLWYKEAVFYEVYVRAFCDLSGTGHGSLSGITSKLDYLHNLGVDCVWLLPIYPSPLKDDGYDVSDYCNVHPDYGRIEDFVTLVHACHERNMKIIADLIPNHCSVAHYWFQEARKDRNSPYRDYFVWSDTPDKYGMARIIFVDVEKSNWTWDEVAGQYYWHRFFSEQPDLNFENPKVQAEFLNIMRFWLRLGIDGFRVDAVPYLFESEGTNCENLQETHDFLKRMRRLIDEEFPQAILLAEACQLPHQVREYFGEGDEFHMGFHFPVMPRIYMSIRKHDATSLREIMATTPDIPANSQWCTFLRNHDELTLEMVTPEERQYMWEQYAPQPRMRINMGIRRRLAPLMDGDRRRIELAYSLLFTLPGSPIIYYGDEIGMGDNIWLNDRNGVRTPMQWNSSSPNAGFSPAEKIYSPVISDEIYGYKRVNVAEATKDPSSLYNVIRTLLMRRRKHLAFGHGRFVWASSNTPQIASFVRHHGIDSILAVHNLSDTAITTRITLPQDFRFTPRKDGSDTSGSTKLLDTLSAKTAVSDGKSVVITLEPYGFVWLNMGEMGDQPLQRALPASRSSRRSSLAPPPAPYTMPLPFAPYTTPQAELNNRISNNVGKLNTIIE